jgi:hypothetical protein
MSSELERLAGAVLVLADEAGEPMRVLAHLRARLQRLQARAGAIGGGDAEVIADRLAAAARSAEAAGEAMSSFRQGAVELADRLANRRGPSISTGGGPSHPGERNPEVKVSGRAETPPTATAPSPPSDPALVSALGGTALLAAVGATAAGTAAKLGGDATSTGAAPTTRGDVVHPGEPDAPAGAADGRYIRPSGDAAERLRQAVGDGPRLPPDRWIASGNPGFADDPVFQSNCGACSRGCAEIMQGGTVAPALGDLRVPPGEDGEMYAALGITQPRVLTRPRPGSAIDPDPDASAFSADAYARAAGVIARCPPGTVAILGVMWGSGYAPRGGHWFNAFVAADGSVRWADMQSGTTGAWPPPGRIWSLEMSIRFNGSWPWKGVDL